MQMLYEKTHPFKGEFINLIAKGKLDSLVCEKYHQMIVQ